MRISKPVTEISEDLEYVWVTHLPNFSITRFEVENVSVEKNGDIRIKLKDSTIYENTIRVRNRGENTIVMKKCYHLTEADAALRLRAHYRNMNCDDIDVMAKRVIGDADDQDELVKNINKYSEKYPEMTI